MRILIAVVNFRYLTGAELYVYELSRCLAARGHDVTIASHTGGEITDRARANGVRVHDYDDFPDALEFDVLHVQEVEPSRWALERYPDVPVVATVHSQWPCEDPMLDARVHKYLCIRPEVRDKIVAVDGVPMHKTSVVYNGVDFSRFNHEGVTEPERDLVLFAGTVDPLRRQAALHLIERSQQEDFDVLFVGTRHSAHLDGPLPPNVAWLEGDVWDIDRYVKACTATAGIVLGRTTLEGWACGKPGVIYDVDLAGNLKRAQTFPPPHNDLLRQFDAEFMTDEIELVYAEAVGAPERLAELRGNGRQRPATGPLAALAGLATPMPPVPADDALELLDRLRPGSVRIEIEEGRRAVLAFAEEVGRNPHLLSAYANEFSGDTETTLVLYATGDDETAWFARMQTALDSAEIDSEAHDILLVLAGAPETLHYDADRFAGVLSDQRPPSALGDLRHVTSSELATLRPGSR